ncbi:MAG TPA: hypothetical protein VF443_13215 [Nitrospira sp.]
MKWPIACTLTPSELVERRDALLPGLFREARSVERLDDGYRLHFVSHAGLLARIAAVLDAERQCCQFMRFELVVTPGQGDFALTIQGPEGTREVLDALRS